MQQNLTEKRGILGNQSGFTLLEVLVTATILAIGLLGSAGMVINSIAGTDRGDKMTLAVRLADMKFEEARKATLDKDDWTAFLVANPVGGKWEAGLGSEWEGYEMYTLVLRNTPEFNMITVHLYIRRDATVGQSAGKKIYKRSGVFALRATAGT